MIAETSRHKKFFLKTLLLGLSFIYGIMVGALEYPPYHLVKAFYKQVVGKPALQDWKHDLKYNKVDPLYQETDVRSLISIKNKTDVFKKRDRLVQYIWGNKGFPDSKMPDIVENNILDERYSKLKNLEKIDKIIVTMDYGFNSVIYHFFPIRSNNNIIIYHQGHKGDFVHGKKTIQFFLNQGYSVMAFAMPLLGMNNRPVVNLKSLGKINFQSDINELHYRLKLLDTDNFSSIKFFVEPIAVSLNFIEEKYNYSSVSMVGISGGAWTAVLCSAIDSRISKSYPVAGSLPIFLRNNYIELGDYEQSLPALYRIANYLELYILGAYGKGRRQVQIINKYDPSCFYGIRYQVYENEVKETVLTLGKGKFEVYLDDTHHDHDISDHALEVIVNNLEEKS